MLDPNASLDRTRNRPRSQCPIGHCRNNRVRGPDAFDVTAISALRRTASRALDIWYNTDTAGKIELPGIHGADQIYYIASPWRSLRRALSPADVTSSDVFLDVGCGKGRMVLEAVSSYRFRRCVGVELVPEIYRHAVRNIHNAERRRRRIRGRVELINQDIRAFAVPDDVSVVFAFNPFRGPVWTAAIDSLIASRDRAPRRIRLVYVNPEEHRQLLGTGRFRVERELPGTTVYELR
jgi:SAM-dependent methyltransferase